MDLFAIGAIIYLLISIVVLFYRPELIIGIQLFFTPVVGSALSSLGFPLGAVLVIFALVVMSFAINVARNKYVNIVPISYVEIVILLFIVWVTITLTYTPAPSYGARKLLFLVTVIFPCVYMARLHCDTPAKLRQTFTTVGWFAIFVLAYYAVYVTMNPSETHRIRSDFFGPLSLGWAVASMVPFIFYVATTVKLFIWRIVAMAAIPTAIFVITSTGSRGPLLAILIASVLSLLRFKYFARTMVGFAVAITVAIVYLSSADLSENKGLGRILGDTEAASRSSEGRVELFSYAREQFQQFPLFGQGSGSFSYFVNSIDDRLYAHNIYLEIAGEFGLVGLILFFTVLILCVVQIHNLRNKSNSDFADEYWAIASIQALFLVGFVISNVSFSVSGQRIFFASMGVIAATTFWQVSGSNILHTKDNELET